MTRPRTGAGTCAHSFWARWACSVAATRVSGVPSATLATTSSRFAGFFERYSPPPSITSGVSGPITELNVACTDMHLFLLGTTLRSP